MKRSKQTTLTGWPSRPSLSLDHRRWGLEINVINFPHGDFVDALCSVDLRSSAVAVSDVQNEWRKVLVNTTQDSEAQEKSPSVEPETPRASPALKIQTLPYVSHHEENTVISWSAFFHRVPMHVMYVFVWRRGRRCSTQANIVRLKMNARKWRRPLIEKKFERKGASFF